MTDAVAFTIGLIGLCLGMLALWRGQRAARRTADLATDDSTGLPNRRRFDLDIDAHAKRGDEPTAILLIDIDPLDSPNHIREHDDVVRTVGGVLAMFVRHNDVAYRYAGRGFSVLLQATDTPAAARIAERIRRSIETAGLRAGGPVTISVGVAAGPAGELRSVVGRADQALHAAQDAGRNRVSIA